MVEHSYCLCKMEKINFNYSLKNTPIPAKPSYQLKLIDKIESVIKRMRWKAFFFLNGDNTKNNIEKETFGFKSKNCPAQRKMKEDICKLKSSKSVYVFADKTTNIYEVPLDEYKKLLKENITKKY